jgi:hypothetical protein
MNLPLEALTNGQPAHGPPAGARRAKRTTGGASLGQDSSRDARRLAAAILEVLAGQRTPIQAAEALTISLPRYYQVEAAALRGLLAACEPKPRGRQVNLDGQVRDLKRANERLQRDLSRQQSLVRLTQRATGLTAPPPPPKAGKKGRKRRPVARALAVAQRLRLEIGPPEATTPAMSS